MCGCSTIDFQFSRKMKKKWQNFSKLGLSLIFFLSQYFAEGFAAAWQSCLCCFNRVKSFFSGSFESVSFETILFLLTVIDYNEMEQLSTGVLPHLNLY